MAAIGAAVYFLRVCAGITPQRFDVYACGRPVTSQDALAAASRHRLHTVPYDQSIVTRRLSEGKVIAMCQGRSELGPRALGNRSLIASADISGIRRKVSGQIKQREWFRPLACVMRSDRFHERFPGAQESPHMLFSYRMPTAFAPEATHNDGTSRIQTIDAADNHRLSDLLADYECATGHSALINTSLNARGKAIAYTAEDVLDDFLANGVDLFILGDLMVDLSTTP